MCFRELVFADFCVKNAVLQQHASAGSKHFIFKHFVNFGIPLANSLQGLPQAFVLCIVHFAQVLISNKHNMVSLGILGRQPLYTLYDHIFRGRPSARNFPALWFYLIPSLFLCITLITYLIALAWQRINPFQACLQKHAIEDFEGLSL